MDARYPSLYALILGFLSLTPAALSAQEAASPAASGPKPVAPATEPVEEADAFDWMVEGLHLAAEGIGIGSDQLFAALMHDLSIAEVAQAHGVLPLELFGLEGMAKGIPEKDTGALEGQAAAWGAAEKEDVAWMLYAKDPFGLNDVAWILEGAHSALDLDMLELATRLDAGVSLSRLALEQEVDPLEIATAAETFLDRELRTLLLLEQIDAEEASSWKAWSLDWLPEALEDPALFETLAEEAWMDEIVALLAEMLVLEEVTLWEHLEEGSTLTEVFEAYEVDLAASATDWGMEPDILRGMLAELEAWLEEDPVEADAEDDRADF